MVVVLLVTLAGPACAAEPSASTGPPKPRAQGATVEREDIDHVAPVPDSVGATPTRFEWSRIEGADHYLLRVWNEVDRPILRADDLRETSVSWPEDERLDLGTYFWSVVAIKDDRPIAESGLAAFVVTR